MTRATHGAARILFVAGLVLLAISGLTYRLTSLHLEGSLDRARAERRRLYRGVLPASRGRVFDSSAETNTLAMNIRVADLCADPAVLVASNLVEETADRFARELHLDAAALRQRLGRPDRRFEYVARRLPKETAESVLALRLPGVFKQDAWVRSYPMGSMMAHVLGFVNDEEMGAAGIEQRCDAYLRGRPGLLESRLDGQRREMVVRRVRQIPAEEGADVYLTLDQHVQYILEKALDQALEQHRARAAWGIVQRVATGEILAMASRPAYDPNDFRRSEDAQRLNRAIGQVYEPGSTFKVAVIAAALNEGLVRPETEFDCENGRWLHENRILRDYHPYARLNVADIIKKSSNIGAAKIALMLGDQRLDAYLRAFGVGRRLGIDLPGEEAGILHPVAQWSRITSSRVAIGQGVCVTALQMLGVMCAIANGGTLMRPYVVRQIVGPDGAVLHRQEPQPLGRPIRPETADLMRELLARVTEEGGTGRRAALRGYRVAGKTGTAQKVQAGGYSESDYIASFVGFLPVEAPQIGMIIVVDEPQPLHTGGVVAAPVFGMVAEQLTRYLDIPPAAYAVAAR